MMTNEQTHSSDSSDAERRRRDFGRKHPLLLAAAVAAETLWLAALAAMACRNVFS